MSMMPQLKIVTGKGGVGKTTVAAALAYAHVQRGARVLLAEWHGRGRAAVLLGQEPVGYALREVTENLWLIDLDGEKSTQEYILMTLRFEALYKALFENRLVHSFLRLLPALGELTMLGKIWYLAQGSSVSNGPEFDVIIIDAPATGHARAVLEAPKKVAHSIPVGPLRTHADNLNAMLLDVVHTQLYVVTTPEALPISEAIELYDWAQQTRMALGPLIVNQGLAPIDPKWLAALRSWQEVSGYPQALATLEAHAQMQQWGTQQCLRLPTAWYQHACWLPKLAQAPVTPDALGRLARNLVDAPSGLQAQQGGWR